MGQFFCIGFKIRKTTAQVKSLLLSQALFDGVLKLSVIGSFSIKFTVVSDPPEEEEQEQECEDVGVAYLRIPEILERQQDMVDVPLNSE